MKWEKVRYLRSYILKLCLKNFPSELSALKCCRLKDVVTSTEKLINVFKVIHSTVGVQCKISPLSLPKRLRSSLPFPFVFWPSIRSFQRQKIWSKFLLYGSIPCRVLLQQKNNWRNSWGISLVEGLGNRNQRSRDEVNDFEFHLTWFNFSD